jgi:HEAT repeat protein
LSKKGKIALVAVAIAVIALLPVREQGRQAGPAGLTATVSAAPATVATATTQPAGADEATRRAVDALLDRAVQDSDQNVRNAALMAISRFGPRAIPALLDGVKNERTAEFSRNLLAGLGLSSMDALLAALDSPDVQVRKEALRTLTQIISSAYTSRPEYGGIMQAPMTGVGTAPGGFGGAGGVVQPNAGLGGYRGPAEMEGGAAFVEGGMPPIEGGVMPEPMVRLIAPVTKAARDDDAGVRREAMQLMSHLVVGAVPAGRTGELMPALQKAMNDADADVRAEAIQALQFAGPAAGSATAALTKAVADENDRVRSAALVALRAIGPAARDATPAVIAALKDPQPPIRALAADTLGALQAPPPPGVAGRVPVAVPGPPAGAEGADPAGLSPAVAPAPDPRGITRPPASPPPGTPRDGR